MTRRNPVVCLGAANGCLTYWGSRHPDRECRSLLILPPSALDCEGEGSSVRKTYLPAGGTDDRSSDNYFSLWADHNAAGRLQQTIATR